MASQIFISYRRSGGDVTAKLICEALKWRGYTVFYDYDALKGGPIDERIFREIESCNDVILVLPPNALDRCENENDWVRLEIAHAFKHHKNIIPVMLPGFEFPDTLPQDIAQINLYNGVRFMMDYFDAVINKIIERLTSTKQDKTDEPQLAPSIPKKPDADVKPQSVAPQPSARPAIPQEKPRQEMPRQEMPRQGMPRQEMPRQEMPRQEVPRQEMPRQEMPRQEKPRQEKPPAGSPATGKLIIRRRPQFVAVARNIKVLVNGVKYPPISSGADTAIVLPYGKHMITFSIDWLSKNIVVEISPNNQTVLVEVYFKTGLIQNTLEATVIQ